MGEVEDLLNYKTIEFLRFVRDRNLHSYIEIVDSLPGGSWQLKRRRDMLARAGLIKIKLRPRMYKTTHRKFFKEPQNMGGRARQEISVTPKGGRLLDAWDEIVKILSGE